MKAKVWDLLLKLVTWGIGHQAVIAKTIQDGATKNIPGLIQDATAIATGVATKQ